MGTLDFLRETVRQAITGDDKFYKQFLYFFELRIPQKLAINGIQTTVLFPLMLAPENLSMDEPFAVEVTQTQGGGLIVEENGIIQRMLRIRGNTGFKPRAWEGSRGLALSVVPPEKRSYSRNLDPFIFDALSGQRHFQYLQDAVFRTYGDLKRDPESAEDTRLFWHNPKDDEHWEVIPQKFSLERSSSKRTIYMYSIDLLIVGKAEAEEIDVSEDKSWLDDAKNGLRSINNAVQLFTGAIRDLNKVVGELTSLAMGIDTILTNTIQILDACNAVVDGIVTVIAIPGTTVKNLLNSVTTFLDNMEEASKVYSTRLDSAYDFDESDPPIPVEVYQSLRSIEVGCSQLLLNPESFETKLQEQIRNSKDLQDLSTSVSAEELAAAGAQDDFSTLAQFDRLGTGLTPGDANRANVELTKSGKDSPAYTALQEVKMTQTDTISGLASRYLGDARKWQDIAHANNLPAPYIMGQAAEDLQAGENADQVPGALGTGKSILVPNFQRPPQERALLPIIGVPITAGLEEKLLGRDLRLTRSQSNAPQYDLTIDTAGGSADIQSISGISNLQQALEIRLIQEKGTDPLYRSVGLRPIVGYNAVPVDQELIQFRIVQSILEDPRIASIKKAEFATPQSDAIEVTIDANVFGLSSAATIRTTL